MVEPTTILLITVAWSVVSLILFLHGYSALRQFDCGLGGFRASDLLAALDSRLTVWIGSRGSRGAVRLRGKQEQVPLYTV